MSVSKGKFRLSNMAFDFVSLVPAGDDPLAQVVIAKADPDQNIDQSSQEESMGTNISKDDLAPEVVTYIEALEDEVTSLTEAVEKADEEIVSLQERSSVSKSAEEQREEVLAKADPAVRALIEKAEQDAKQASEIAKAERDQRLDREFIAKAEALPMLSTDKTMLGALLRRISEALSAEDATAVTKMLDAANVQIAKGNLFSEMGRGGGETTVSKSVDAAAQELMKSQPGLTMEQAQAKVYETNPALLADAMTQES